MKVFLVCFAENRPMIKNIPLNGGDIKLQDVYTY